MSTCVRPISSPSPGEKPDFGGSAAHAFRRAVLQDAIRRIRPASIKESGLDRVAGGNFDENGACNSTGTPLQASAKPYT